MKVVFWGTYDTGKPRTRILLRGLQENGVTVSECHSTVWYDVEDKSQVRGPVSRLGILIRWISKYPSLITRYLKSPRHDAVVVAYMGHLDVLMLWPFARMRRIPIVWDAFLSLYNTVVEDRKLVSKWNPLAVVLYCWEWLACRACDLLILDTQAHADYFADKFHVEKKELKAVFVGAEVETFHAAAGTTGMQRDDALLILFYGQFIPLHGIETIVRAARKMKNEAVQWVLIGKGQEAEKIQMMLDHEQIPNLQWIPWVEYNELNDWIHKADICLGIFSDSEKASRVIPNKVFQIIACGKPLITRDSPAVRELLSPEDPGVYLVPPNDPQALIDAIHACLQTQERSRPLHERLQGIITPVAVGKQFGNHIGQLIKSRSEEP